jgi:hypothetical protein
MKPSKLSCNLETEHKNAVGKQIGFFQWKLKEIIL